MKNLMNWQRGVVAGLGVAWAVLGGVGCATGGGRGADGAASGSTTAGVGAGAFYADWYDPAAIVLPPPPAPSATDGRR